MDIPIYHDWNQVAAEVDRMSSQLATEQAGFQICIEVEPTPSASVRCISRSAPRKKMATVPSMNLFDLFRSGWRVMAVAQSAQDRFVFYLAK